jgi:hypothetical protein
MSHSNRKCHYFWGAGPDSSIASNATVFGGSLPEIRNGNLNIKDTTSAETLNKRGCDIGSKLPFFSVFGYFKSSVAYNHDTDCKECNPSIWVSYPLLHRILQIGGGLTAYAMAGFIMLLAGFWGINRHGDITHFLITLFVWLFILHMLDYVPIEWIR